MKKTLFTLVLLMVFVTACHKQKVTPDHVVPDNIIDMNDLNGMYILNEGIMDHNNSSISYYNLNDNSLATDIFTAVNNRGLGDTGNDLQRYGSRLYCVVNKSGTVEVMDVYSARVIGTVFFGSKEPRRICFEGSKAYVSCFDGTVVRFDTASLEVEAIVTVGSNPDGICSTAGKLYVANSGGVEAMGTGIYGNTVSVVDLASFSVVKNITVAINPTRLYLAPNHQDIFLISNGNYGDVPTRLQKINTVTDEVVRTFDFEITNLALYGNNAYLYFYDYSLEDYTIKVMDLSSENIIKEQFISDGTKLDTPYGITVNPKNGDVYVTDAHNWAVNGDVYCFDQSGRRKFNFEVGISPSMIVFLN